MDTLVTASECTLLEMFGAMLPLFLLVDLLVTVVSAMQPCLFDMLVAV